MRHFVYAMDGSKPAPAGCGDTASWFLYYKWNVGGEAFVPVSETVGELPVKGDLIWFLLDTYVLGYAAILEVREDGAVNGTVEVVYDTQDMRAGSPHDHSFPFHYPAGMASEEASVVLTGLQSYFDGLPRRSEFTDG